MRARPVILRELRGEARNPINYWLRVLGAGALIGVFALIMINQAGSAAALGARLFAQLNSTLLLAVMIAVPLLTADCISREKREGTLGLLFLTPLTARDILLGKALIHKLRALTIVIAALPIVVLPFLLGGVTGISVAHTIATHLSVLLIALAAGLLASVWQVEWIRAVVFAEAFSASGVVLNEFLARLLQLLSSSNLFGLENLIAAMILFLAAFQVAGRRLERSWQEETAAPGQPNWTKIFSKSDFWQSFFRWDKSRTLDRNPIAWLQEYSWTARLTKWGWLFLILGVELVVLLNYTTFSFFELQVRLAFLLSLGMAFTAAWSFRRERQSGALELLLVTPLQARQLIRGRLWGLLCHFSPSIATLLLLWIFNPFNVSRSQIALIWFFLGTFLSLPVIGLHFSLLRVHFLTGWLLTLVTGLLVPYMAFLVAMPYTRRHYGLGMTPYILVTALQFGIAALAWHRLKRNLTDRTFALERNAT